MSGHQSVLNVHFVFLYMCFLHVCISRTLTDSRQKRYTEADICYESRTTIEKVDICPQHIEKLNRRSIKKNCSRHQSCTDDPLVYHCVTNGGGLVEVCAPRSLITGRFCPYYEKGLGRVIENKRKRCIMCPFQYHSDGYFKNSECIPASVAKEGSSGQSSSINVNITTPKPHPSSTNKGISIVEGLGKHDSIFPFEVVGKHTEYGFNDESVASGTDLRNRQDTEKHTDQNDTDIIVLVVVISICSCLVLGISLICFFRVKTVCLMFKGGQKHINIHKDLKEPQVTDLFL